MKRKARATLPWSGFLGFLLLLAGLDLGQHVVKNLHRCWVQEGALSMTTMEWSAILEQPPSKSLSVIRSNRAGTGGPRWRTGLSIPVPPPPEEDPEIHSPPVGHILSLPDGYPPGVPPPPPRSGLTPS